MLRTCPKCGAFYAVGSPFCLADGTPLLDVDPASEKWSEGSRIVEEQSRKLARQTRRLKWRRILTTGTTLVIVTMVVTMVAVNSWIYLKPKAVANDNQNLTNENLANNNVANNNLANENRGNENRANDNRPNENSTNENGGNENRANENQANDNKSNDNGNVSLLVDDPCSAAAKDAAVKTVLKLINQKWQWNSRDERRLVISRFEGPGIRTEDRERRDRKDTVAGDPRNVENGVVAEPVKMAYTTAFSKDCSETTVTFDYTWNVWRLNTPAVVHKIPNVKRFRCTKSGANWSCNEEKPQARYVSVPQRTLI